MKKITIAALLLALTACDAMEDSANVAGSGLKQNYDMTRKHISKWIFRWSGDEGEPPPPKVLANAYCYNVRADILCYEQPRENLGTRLVAYQGSTAYPPGYVAPAPAPMNDQIVSYDVPPPFAPASDETMAKVYGGRSGSSVTSYSPSGQQPGVPAALMQR